jgi:hypothetical protein
MEQPIHLETPPVTITLLQLKDMLDDFTPFRKNYFESAKDESAAFTKKNNSSKPVDTVSLFHNHVYQEQELQSRIATICAKHGISLGDAAKKLNKDNEIVALGALRSTVARANGVNQSSPTSNGYLSLDYYLDFVKQVWGGDRLALNDTFLKGGIRFFHEAIPTIGNPENAYSHERMVKVFQDENVTPLAIMGLAVSDMSNNKDRATSIALQLKAQYNDFGRGNNSKRILLLPKLKFKAKKVSY